MEGLAGIKNTGLAYESSTISPRWMVSGIDSINVTANLSASNGYISYQFKNDKSGKTIALNITGSGKNSKLHLLLPESTSKIKAVSINNRPVNYKLSKIENSIYLDVDLLFPQVQKLVIVY